MAGRALCIVIPLLLALISAPAEGADTIKIAIPDVRPVGKVDATVVEPLSALLASDVARREGVSVLSAADIRTMLGFEAQKQLLGCSEDQSCLAEIGGALGADLLISSEASMLGESYFVTVVVLETASATGVGRATAEAQGEGALVAALRGAIDAALDPALARLRGEAPPEAPPVSAFSSPGGVGPLPDEGAGAGRGGLFWTALAVGAASALTGGGLLLDGNLTHQRWSEDPSTVTWARAQTAQTEAKVGGGLLIAGAAIGAGAFLLPRPKHLPARVALLPTPGGFQAMITLELMP
ncbi:MAG: hypothetical protein P1V51_11365 [Deltaproteobacteria bacterium]|nr:hypothetical protein [Deltaproteobacteria bacterium]